MSPAFPKYNVSYQPSGDAVPLRELPVATNAVSVEPANLAHIIFGKLGVLGACTAHEPFRVQAGTVSIASCAAFWVGVTAVGFTARDFFGMCFTSVSLALCIPPFLVPVCRVSFVRAFKQVGRVAARRVVACVADAFVRRYIPGVQKECDAMSKEGAFFGFNGRLPYAVPVFLAEAFPRPAVIAATLRYVGVKALCLLRGELRKDTISFSHFSLHARLIGRAVRGVTSTGAARLSSLHFFNTAVRANHNFGVRVRFLELLKSAFKISHIYLRKPVRRGQVREGQAAIFGYLDDKINRVNALSFHAPIIAPTSASGRCQYAF